MNVFVKYFVVVGIQLVLVFEAVLGIVIKECNQHSVYDKEVLTSLVRSIVPSLDNKMKGEAGKIGVIGGSIEYTGAPYFAAITSLKVGADLVFVLTTESSAPIIKSYSPELIVYPFLNKQSADNINNIIKKMDVVIIGPGLGKDNSIMEIVSKIMIVCRNLKKPLIVDADGLYLVSKNLSLIQNYPSPGTILLPNHIEMERIQVSMKIAGITGFEKLGPYTSVLIKGKTDNYISSRGNFSWSFSENGSGRRAGGQGDILAGALGTLFNWAVKSNICENENSNHLAASVATFGATKLTRVCNEKAFKLYGRSMTASDMLVQIHLAFQENFENTD